MELSQLRNQIDAVDVQFVELFVKRMELCAQVAQYKKAQNMPIFVPEREEVVLQAVEDHAGQVLAPYARRLYHLLFALSRDYQANCLDRADNEVTL